MVYQKMRVVIFSTLFFGLVFFMLQCGGFRDTGQPDPPSPAGTGEGSSDQVPARKYAAELLSYMMQVVVGAAGDPGSRKAWKTRSLSVNLDFQEIGFIMQDPERKVSELMVYDANILGLSSVLYHYNRRLNYFKGASFIDSLYPSAELLAIRLFMVQKIARGKKARLGYLVAHEKLLEDPLAEPTEAELAAVNLNAEELRLLRDVIRSEPFFKDYLEDPFLVEALHRVGVVEMDAYVKTKIREADYGYLVADRPRGDAKRGVVKVAILPSMTKMFDFQAEGTPGFSEGFRATDDYTRAVEALKQKLKAALARRVQENLNALGDAASNPAARAKTAANIVDTRLQFLDLDKRPLVIYPDNAEKVIQTLCPDADFNFILLGKNVYLSIYFDAQRDIFPSANRVYLDITDIQRTQSDYDIDQVGEFLFNRLKPFV